MSFRRRTARFGHAPRTRRSASCALAVALSAVALSGSACREPTATRGDLPSGARPLDPPFAYEQWWAWTQTCAGVTGRFDAVRWYVVPGPAVTVDGTSYDAFWLARGNRVAIAEPYVAHGSIVRHEMLHALLARGDHPAEFFQRRCVGVVECAGTCRAS